MPTHSKAASVCGMTRENPSQKGTKMKSGNQPLTKLKAWKSLAAHSRQAGKLHLRKLFAQDAKRGDKMAIEACGLFLDYSKNRVTGATLKLLLQLAAESKLRAKID